MKDLSKGKSRNQISEELKSQFNVADITISRDFADVYDVLASTNEKLSKSVKDLIVSRYEFLWEKAIENDDYKLASQILKQLSDLFGLNVKKSEVSVKETDFTISFE